MWSSWIILSLVVDHILTLLEALFSLLEALLTLLEALFSFDSTACPGGIHVVGQLQQDCPQLPRLSVRV